MDDQLNQTNPVTPADPMATAPADPMATPVAAEPAMPTPASTFEAPKTECNCDCSAAIERIESKLDAISAKLGA